MEGKYDSLIFIELIQGTCFQSELIHKIVIGKREFKACFLLWKSGVFFFFTSLGDGACILPCLLPSFVFWTRVWVFCLVHNSQASSKEEPCPCMLGSKNTVSLVLSNTQTRRHAHTLNSMGDVFPVLCMVWGDESTSLKYKVGLQGFTGRIFLSFANPWLKGLQIKLEGLSSELLLSLPLDSFSVLAKSAVAHLCLQHWADLSWPSEIPPFFFFSKLSKDKYSVHV